MTAVESTAEAALEDRLGEAGAARALRSRWRVASGLAASAGDRLDLVRLPVAICAATPRGDPTAGQLHVVERVLGHGWSIVVPSASSGDRASSSQCAPIAGRLLPGRLGLDACEPRLLALVLHSVLRMGLRRSTPPASLAPLEAARAADYPFWLRYRRDRRGRVCFDAVDAVTGRRASAPLRAAIAAALIDADREAEPFASG